MSLHNLGRFGLLTKETTLILQTLDKNENFKNAEIKLYESGFTSSKSHASRILFEIKKRIYLKKENLPDKDYLIDVAKSNFNSIIKGQIYFVYLYNTDIFVSHITEKLGEIFYSNYDNPVISRESIKILLKTYLTSKSIKGQKKAIENWIGRYLSIMREINILIRKKNHNYFINLLAIMPETWYFFALHSHFNNYPLFNSEFFRSFQIKPSIIPEIIKKVEIVNSKVNKMINTHIENGSLKIETSHNSIQDWVVSVE